MMNHNDFPKMTEEFDRSVRRALDSLPERESKPVRRFSAKKIVCAGLAAALCIGGTAFAANAQSWFPLLFPNGGDANLEGYVQTADNAKLTDENEHYRLSVESVLFDESAGTGVISLHLENKKQDGVKPFTLAHLIDSYRNKPDITWSTLSSCYAEEGQLAFEVMYGDSGFCGSEFYLDTARSTDNDYYSRAHLRFRAITGRESRSVWRRSIRAERPCVRTERVLQRRFWRSICRNFSRCRT